MGLPKNLCNSWFKISNQNLAVFMRDAGFDLTVYQSYPEAVQEEAKRLSINKAISSLREAFKDQTENDLSAVKHGVYIIRVSGNMSLKYRNGHSPVIYIGQGNIETRLKSHYQVKLFDFMESLSGINFDFYICEPWKKHYRQNDFHKQVEHLLIEDFSTNYGGVSEARPFPLMNKRAGSNRSLEVDNDWWRKPLKRSGSKTSWILEAGPSSDFVGALD